VGHTKLSLDGSLDMTQSPTISDLLVTGYCYLRSGGHNLT